MCGDNRLFTVVGATVILDFLFFGVVGRGCTSVGHMWVLQWMSHTPTTMATPQDVTAFVVNGTGCAQSLQFWPVVHYLFQDYNGAPVWQQVPPSTFRTLVLQLTVAIEALENLEQLTAMSEVLSRLYFVLLTKLNEDSTCTALLERETPQVLQSLHHLYRLLFRLDVPHLPLFGHAKT
jgi:hypothetical protein